MKTSKRFISGMLVFLMLLTLIPVNAAALENAFPAGDGTISNPYQIATANQLDAIRCDLNAHYILLNDIDLESFGSWIPIGTYSSPFCGSLDGNGYSICGMRIDYNSAVQLKTENDTTKPHLTLGLFGVLGSGAICKNLSIENCNINFVTEDGSFLDGYLNIGYFMGIIAGCIHENSWRVNIQDCTVDGSIYVSIPTWPRDGFWVGGIVGNGGGVDSSTISSCTNNAEIISEKGVAEVGGICGIAGTLTINDCTNNAAIHGSAYRMGGIAGGGGGSTILSCENRGEISVEVSSSSEWPTYHINCGGITGIGCRLISQCVNYGDISAINTHPCYSDTFGVFSGGICGYNNNDAWRNEKIENCKNYAKDISAKGVVWTDSTATVSKNRDGQAHRIFGFGNIVLENNYSSASTLINGTLASADMGLDKQNGENLNDQKPDDEQTSNTFVGFFNKFEDDNIYLNFSELSYTLSNDVDISLENNLSKLLNKYVLVTTKQGESGLGNIITNIQPVESKIGTVTDVGSSVPENGASYLTSITIDGNTYSVLPQTFTDIDTLENTLILYHLSSNVVVGFELLQCQTGRLDDCNQTANRVVIDGQEYSTNYMTDWSFADHFDELEDSRVGFYTGTIIDGRTSLPFLFRVVESTESTYINMYATDADLSINPGDSFDVICKLYRDDLPVENWEKPAFVVGNEEVIQVSNYKVDSEGYHFRVTGLKEGSSSLIVSDSDTGSSVTVSITVGKDEIVPLSYRINKVPSFYPNVIGDKHTKTNFYNLNGLYVKDYTATENKSDGSWEVSFSVYNHSYMYGAVDIYDKDGNWKESEMISKYTEVSGLCETGMAACWLVADGLMGNSLSYTAHTWSKCTPIKITVPEGGYFTISNNYLQSPGTYLYNTMDLLVWSASEIVSNGLDLSKSEELLKKAKEELTTSQLVRNEFLKRLQSAGTKLVKNVGLDIAEQIDKTDELGEEIFKDIFDWKELYAFNTGLGEAALHKLMGPVGDTMKVLFSISKYLSYGAQTISMGNSINKQYITIFTPENSGSMTVNGITVTPDKDSVDSNAVLQVFRVSTNDSIIIADGEFQVDQYELYNICFVKDDQEVQPNGRVTVKIPVPYGFPGDRCTVYRQESDGHWTALDARIDGNYLAFETNHFSLYAVVNTSGDFQYEVRFSTGKGSIVPSQLIDNGHTVKEPVSPTYEGYTFGGWFKDAACTKTWNFKTDIVTENITLYAKWNKIDSGTPGNGGSSSGSSGNSSAGSPATSHGNVTVSTSTNGSVEISPQAPKKDDTVTLTVKSDSGYELKDLTVKDGNGKEISLTKVNDTTYTFTMPDGKVTVNPSFAKVKERPPVMAFTDVPSDAYYADAIAWAVTQNVTVGTGANTFSPNNPCTRAQMVTFLWRAAGSPAPQGDTNPFTDIQSGTYYYDAVLWATEQGITNGTDDDTFSPNATVSRGQTVTFLYRYADSPSVTAGDRFSDVSSTDYYANAVQWAVDNGITNGTGANTFSPVNDCTRGQIVTFLYRQMAN